MTGFCGQCGQPVKEGAQFCGSCGAAVKGASDRRGGREAAGAQPAQGNLVAAAAARVTDALPQAATYQCPNCNGVLAFDAATGRLACEHCGGAFDEGEITRAIPVGAGVQANATTHVTTVDEFLQTAPWQVGSGDYANAVSYSCPSCGAGVVADQATVSTDCPYCGNTMLVAGISNSQNVPQKVLPFSLTRDQAEASLRAHFKGKWYLSRKFDASLEHMQGVYVPYHLYDFDVSGFADYIGYYETPEDDDGNSTKYYYGIKRSGHAAFRNIPVDGSSKMPDAHMDAISPFAYEKMRDFSPSYIAGYLTEVADEDPQQCLPRADERARRSFEGALAADARREKGVDGIEEVVASQTDVTLRGVTPCVLPVWLAHCTWEDNQMLFAVNGDTGKCVGDLPIEGKRRILTIAGVVAAALLVAILLFVTVFLGTEDDISFIGGAAFFTVLLAFLVDGHFMRQMRTAMEAEDADESFDEAGLVVDFRWRSKKRYLRESKAHDALANWQTS